MYLKVVESNVGVLPVITWESGIQSLSSWNFWTPAFHGVTIWTEGILLCCPKLGHFRRTPESKNSVTWGRMESLPHRCKCTSPRKLNPYSRKQDSVDLSRAISYPFEKISR
jgi:hypothetical protein